MSTPVIILNSFTCHMGDGTVAGRSKTDFARMGLGVCDDSRTVFAGNEGFTSII